MKRTWKKYLLYGSLIIIGGILVFVLVQTVRAKNTGFETKMLWDWLELLIIPLVLAIGAFYLERSERAVDSQTAEVRARVEREIATDRQQEAALQAYLDRMAELLLEKKRGANLSQALLMDTKLRGANVSKADLNQADLSAANLERANLEYVDLTGADLSRTKISQDQLAVAKSLKGAIMPDGTKHN